MNKKLLLWSIVVALGGFLFGIDVAVISGAEQEIKNVWKLTDVMHGVAIGMALYGTVIGAMTGGIPAARFGRKKDFNMDRYILSRFCTWICSSQ